ncbi:MAG: acyl CoA:acetate/3-ketoacid CoA transferase [Enterocloster bolteae]
MRKPIFVSAQEAIGMIQDYSTLCTIGMTLVSASETVLKAIEQKFLDTGTPRGLTLFHTCGQSDRKDGIAHLAHEGLVTKVIGGHWGLCPPFMEMISENRLEAYNLPQGQMANMFHSMALREPGKLSKIGLGTFVDPRIEGGKMNSRTMDKEDIVAVVTVDGEEYMQYREVPIDTLVIRGTYADEAGNISTEEEAMVLEVLPAVMAAKRFGGKVICQVKQVVRTGTLDPKRVAVPGVMVDAVVVCENPMEEHKQTSSWYFDPSYSGQIHTPLRASSSIPLNIRKVIGRRAAMLLKSDVIINVGTGIPNDVIGPILAEEDVQDDVMLTVESGIYGGVPAGGIDFGISCSPQALIPHDRQFEYYTGAGIDYTFMGAGEMDAQGNVNATKMGSVAAGAGGFIDITSTAKNVVFCSTFTGGQIKVEFDECGIKILQEGRFRKLVKKVQQISYNGKMAVSRGQNMFYVTERAVFQLTEDGPMLIEIARGADLERDILANMEFRPLIAEHIKETPIHIYREGPFGLKNIIKG